MFLTDPDQIVALAARNGMPVINAWRSSVAVDGLMSYATNLLGLGGELVFRPARFSRAKDLPSLPVLQPAKFEFLLTTICIVAIIA